MARPMPKALFNHIPKTGGVALGGALSSQLPPGHVSPPIFSGDPDAKVPDPGQWRVVRGHLGFGFADRVSDAGERLKFTVVREPVARFMSEYNYWRYHIDSNHPAFNLDYIQAAKRYGFSEFLRWRFVEQKQSANFQTWFLSGIGVSDGTSPEAVAREALAHYDVVGVTDDLPKALDAISDRLDVRLARPASELLSMVNRNSSSGENAVCADDRDFIEQRAPMDLALYQEARRRAS